MEPATPASPPGHRLRSLRRLLVGLAVAATVVAAVPAAAAADTARRPGPVAPAGTAPTGTAQADGPMYHEGVEIDQPPLDGGALVDYSGPANSANARFVVAGYRELVGRDPDTGGLDFHLGRIAGGGDRSRTAFTYALLFSAEGSRNEVTRAYDAILDRSPDQAGADYWTAHLQGHGVADLQVLLLASDEYVLRSGGSETSWLQALYQETLGRPADQAGLAYWLERRSAGVPRALVAAAIHQSTESLARRAAELYQDVLGRGASQAEIDGTVATLRLHDDRTVRARMFGSDEAFEPHLRPVVT